MIEKKGINVNKNNTSYTLFDDAISEEKSEEKTGKNKEIKKKMIINVRK